MIFLENKEIKLTDKKEFTNFHIFNLNLCPDTTVSCVSVGHTTAQIIVDNIVQNYFIY